MIHEDGKSEVREWKGRNSFAAEEVRTQVEKEGKERNVKLTQEQKNELA